MVALTLCVLFLQSAPRPAPPSAPSAQDAATSSTDSPKPVHRGPVPGLVAAESRPVQIATGFRFTGGPAADAKGVMYFVDVPTSRVMRITSQRLTAEGATSNATSVIVNNGSCFGLMFAVDGRLFAAQAGSHGPNSSGALIEIDLTTKKIVQIAKEATVDGTNVRLGRVNDLAIDSEGGIYVTDPSLGPTPSATRGILYRAKDGAVRRVDASIEATTCVRLTADGTQLYALSGAEPGVYRLNVTAPGIVGPAVRVGQLLGADGVQPRGHGAGFAIDEKGNLWCAKPDLSEIQIVRPDGAVAGRIAIPEPPSGCAFGGEDGKTLFVTAMTSMYAFRTETVGTWPARRGPSLNPANGPTSETR